MSNREKIILLAIILIAAFLRLYRLDQNPPSLYWDEVSLGYNAYALKTAGVDEHGEYFPITRFIAFGDYKPPGYIYSIIPFYFLFGVNEFAVRFPSSMAGILMVIFTYLLVVKLTQNKTAGLVASALLAISPWSLQLSRAAFEAHLAALFNLLGIYFFVSFYKRKWYLPLSVLFFIAAFYTFNANRIISPLIIALLSFIYWRPILQSKKWLLVTTVLSVLLMWPNISYFQTRESKLRFQEVSIFTSLDTVKKANERIALSGNTWWARVLHNRRVYFVRDFLSHYLDHFKGYYLFISGDTNPRLSGQFTGELYLFELPLLLAGLYLVVTKRSKTSALLLGWMLIAPIPAGMARETPHMLRTASVLPTFQILSGIGVVGWWQWLQTHKKSIRISIYSIYTFLVIGFLIYYFHNYWVHYPLDWSGQWQYGYKQMVEKVKKYEANYDHIYVTEAFGRPYIYFLYYNKVDPLEYVRTRKANRDWYGFWNVYGFGKYQFSQDTTNAMGKILRVTGAGQIDKDKLLDTVTDPNGKVVFEIGIN